MVLSTKVLLNLTSTYQNVQLSCGRLTRTKAVFQVQRSRLAYSYSFSRQSNPLDTRNNMTPSPSSSSGNSSDSRKPVILRISVDGNISSGKSTLVQSLEGSLKNREKYQVEVIPEPLQKWTNMKGHNLLGLLYQNTVKNNFMFQHYVQLTRLMDTVKNDKAKEGVSGNIRIMERSLQNNRYCFAELAKRQGSLHGAEFAVLAEWYNWLDENVDLTLDLIIYLRTSPQVVYDRMQSRGREEESTVPINYLSDLHDTYEDWLVHGNIVEEKFDGSEKRKARRQKVLVVDADQGKQAVAMDCTKLMNEFLKEFEENQKRNVST